MRKRISTLSIVLFLACTGWASQETPVFPRRMVVEADAGEPFGEVIVTVHVKNHRFKGVVLKVKGVEHEVPKRAFVDLGAPLLDRGVKVRREPGWDKFPWLHLRFVVTVEDDAGNWVPCEVTFSYHNGRIEKRFLTTTEPEDASNTAIMDLTK